VAPPEPGEVSVSLECALDVGEEEEEVCLSKGKNNKGSPPKPKPNQKQHMTGEGTGDTTSRADPELLELTNHEKFVEDSRDDTSVDEFEADDSLTELELCAQYCRTCTVSVQRLFHVRSLGEVCMVAMREGSEAFPLDLVEDLAQDDDSEVRQIVAEQLGALAEALKETRDRQEEDVAVGLLYVAFLLVEDDVDGVVSAAESAVVTVATLMDTAEGQELLLTQIANLSMGEEEEIRVSGAKIVGALASALGPNAAREHLSSMLGVLTKDEALHVREVTARAIVLVAEAMDDQEAEEMLMPLFCSLVRDPVWSVRKVCADNLVELSKCVSRGAFVELATAMFESLVNDVSFQVRTASLEQLGPLIAELGNANTPKSLVDHFVSMAESNNAGPGDLKLACAFNIPGVAYTIGRERWHEIRDAYDMLAHSVNWRVRRSLACSLHEMARVLGEETAEVDLLPILEEMLGDTDEVSIGVVANLAKFMSELSPAARLPHLELLPGIVATDAADMIGNWRLRAAMSEQLGALSGMLPAHANEETLLPLLLRLLKDPASAVRAKCIEAAGVVLQNTTKGGGSTWRAGQVGGVISDLKLMATNPRWVDRQAYAQICGAFVGVVDASVVIDELLPLMLMLVEDTVPNVRRELAKSLAVFQAHPAFAGISDLKDAVGAMRNDPDADVCQTVKSMCDTFDDFSSEHHHHRDEFTTGLRITPMKSHD
jgi:serine/threonine-protein phosphatase 4 regulatory subunit 1